MKAEQPKKKLTLLIIFLSLVVFGLFLLRLSGITVLIQDSYSNKMELQSPATQTSNELVDTLDSQTRLFLEMNTQFVRIEKTNEAQKLEIRIEYPQFSGLKNEVAQEALNKYLEFFFERYSQNFSDQEASISAKKEEGSEVYSYLYTLCRPSLIRDQIVSVYCASDVYSYGATHPMTLSLTIVYDLQKKSALKLEDLFVDQRFLKIVSDYSTIDLERQFRRERLLEQRYDGSSPDQKNFDKWALTSKNMILFFDPYQVGSYTAGSFTVDLPYDLFEGILKPEYEFLTQTE